MTLGTANEVVITFAAGGGTPGTFPVEGSSLAVVHGYSSVELASWRAERGPPPVWPSERSAWLPVLSNPTLPAVSYPSCNPGVRNKPTVADVPWDQNSAPYDDDDETCSLSRMDKLRRALAGDDGRDDDSTTGIMPPTPDSSTPLLLPSNLDATTLSWSTRIKCFAFCFILGILVSMLASLSLFLHRGWSQFAVLYTLGNVISMLSTLFLMGPVNQVKKMFAPTRVVATIMVLLLIVLTLISGLVIKNPGLAFLFIILQWMAMTWYSLSYIPYARDAVKKTVETCIA